VVTDKLIYFYRIPRGDDLFIPKLRGTMFNYMQCTGFQLDSLGMIAASFKTNQPNIDIYERKLNHGFHEYIHRESKEGVCGSNLTSLNCFLISDDDYVELHDAENFKSIERLDLRLQESKTQDLIEILSMVVSQSEKYLGVFAGKNCIKEEEEIF
jgi:hypothetical protein